SAEAGHALVETAFAHGLQEVILAQGLEAVDQRRADHAFLVGAVAAVAGGAAPGAKALHGVGIDLVPIHHGVERFLLVRAVGQPDEGRAAGRGNDDSSVLHRSIAPKRTPEAPKMLRGWFISSAARTQ